MGAIIIKNEKEINDPSTELYRNLSTVNILHCLDVLLNINVSYRHDRHVSMKFSVGNQIFISIHRMFI